MNTRLVGRTLVIALLGITVALAGIPLNGQAQNRDPVTKTEGTLASVDLAGMMVTLQTFAGTRVFRLTSLTVVHIGVETAASISSLASFVGAQATVLSGEVDGAAVAGLVSVEVFPAGGTVGSTETVLGNGDPGGPSGGSTSGGGSSSGSSGGNDNGNGNGNGNGGGNGGAGGGSGGGHGGR